MEPTEPALATLLEPARKGDAEALETLVAFARQGHREALEGLVAAIQDPIYRLALRMLYHPSDAADATQEILVRVVTHLGTLANPRVFRTWVYRIAVNTLLTTRRRRAEERSVTFEQCELEAQAASATPRPGEATGPEHRALLTEVRLACLHGLLLCLDRDHRIAFLLGELFQLSGDEAADILSVSPEAYRQRLARSRDRLLGFLRRNCGLARPENPCQCEAQLPLAVKAGWVRPGRLRFAGHPVREGASAELPHEVDAAAVDELGRLVALYREQPRFAAPDHLIARLRTTLTSQPPPCVAP